MGVCKTSEFDPVVQTGTGLWHLTQMLTGVFLLFRRHANNTHSAKKSEVDLPWPKSLDSESPIIYATNN